MEEKSILKGDCEYCGPSQSGPDPLPSPQKVIDQRSFLVERPASTYAKAEAILPVTEVAGQPLPVAELQKNQEIKEMLDSGAPYIAIFRIGENNLKLIPGNGADGITVAGLLHYAMKQC